MRRIIGALVLLSSAPALAQQPPVSTVSPVSAPAPPSAAAALIAAASAPDLFEALPSDTQVVVRHSRSGLTCRMHSSWRNRIMIFPDAARGEDVACESTNGSANIRLYATRYSFRTTLDQQINGAIAVIRQTSPDARDYTPTIAQAFPGLPATRTADFLLTRASNHAQMYSHVSVAMVSGWVYVLRYSAPAADAAAAHQAEIAAHALWQDTLGEVASGRL
ncbi:MAG: hypothetical protein HY054_15890 [Proteobacteria bacterium]|nr:hypothetical protein [Pseudomonadota bacterium]